MKTVFLFLTLFVLIAKLSQAQKDSIHTVLIEKITARGDTITKQLIPWKTFYVFTKPDFKKHVALLLEEAGDSSMVIITKAIHPRYNAFNHDTIAYKDICLVTARTKHYNLKRGLGIVMTIGGSIMVIEGIGIITAVSPIAGGIVAVIGSAAIVGSTFIIRMRKFDTKDGWTFKAGYLVR